MEHTPRQAAIEAAAALVGSWKVREAAAAAVAGGAPRA